MIPGALPPSLRSPDDVLDVLPAELRQDDTAAVRDALAAALFELIDSAEEAADFAAAQSDPLRAVEADEDELFEDRGVARAADEPDETYRERALDQQNVASFTALRDAVNKILATATTSTCRISEAVLDRWFLGSGADDWHSHIGRTPTYPERLFDFPAGSGVPGNDPGGLRMFNDTVGRHFLVCVPDLSGAGDVKLIANSIGTTNPGDARLTPGFFVGRAEFPAFVGGGQYDIQIYSAIISAVTSLVGHSVRWTLIVDPNI